MGKKIIKFDNTEFEIYKFYQHNRPFLIENFGKKKVSNIKNKFDSKPVYNDKYLKTKIKSCNGKNRNTFS